MRLFFVLLPNAWQWYGGLFIILLSPALIATPLDDLLQEVKQARQLEQHKNAARIARFQEQRDQQQRLLAQAKAELAASQARLQVLTRQFEGNKTALHELQTTLQTQSDDLAQVFNVARQSAADTQNKLSDSLVSAQFVGRAEQLNALLDTRVLPEISTLRGLWLAHLTEMVESGKVTRFNAPLIYPDGSEQTAEIVRVGGFTAVSEGRFLRWLPGSQRLVVLARQPAPRFQTLAREFSQTHRAWMPMIVDASRGELLAQLVQTPDWRERLAQGGLIGYIIIGLGVLGILLVLERIIALSVLTMKINRQRTQPPCSNNPLGRILQVAADNLQALPETLELKLDEAILRELPQVKRRLGSIGVLAAIAPLLGLLGTVTGIIHTFQTMSVLGSSDPKLMSGGISEALITTELGLIMAIPLLLLHTLLSNMSNRLIHELDIQSAALVAQQAESNRN